MTQPYRGPFQAIWDLSTPALSRIVACGPRHLQYEAAQRELGRRLVPTSPVSETGRST